VPGSWFFGRAGVVGTDRAAERTRMRYDRFQYVCDDYNLYHADGSALVDTDTWKWVLCREDLTLVGYYKSVRDAFVSAAPRGLIESTRLLTAKAYSDLVYSRLRHNNVRLSVDY